MALGLGCKLWGFGFWGFRVFSKAFGAVRMKVLKGLAHVGFGRWTVSLSLIAKLKPSVNPRSAERIEP